MSDKGSDTRADRERMDIERQKGEKAMEPAGRPKRYKLYDRIAGKLSLNAINIIISAVSLLLIAAVIYGVATRGM